jgi:hypothetical protein
MTESVINPAPDPVSGLVFNLIFSGLSYGLAETGTALTNAERDQISRVIYNTLRDQIAEVRMVDGLERLRQVNAEIVAAS